MKDIDNQRFMHRALELAALGSGSVSPNPLVGCVVVHENKIIGEGWHKQHGDWHAEANAINSVENKALLPESTVFVTLEPCSHQGKTPPCADLLIREKVKKVIICNADPFPAVNGKGIEKLRQAGIAVAIGLLENEGKRLNKRFFTFTETQRPYIFLKWAETADGFIGKIQESSGLISNDLSRKLVHKMRAETDAVMVGTNTALYDNPQLNVRDWKGRNPLRIVLDRHLRLPTNLNIFDKSQPTICYNLTKDEVDDNLIFVKLKEKDNFLTQIIEDLYQRKIQSLLVEGGTQLLSQFFKENLWDELYVFKSPKTFGSGIPAPVFQAGLQEIVSLQEDSLFIYQPLKNASVPDTVYAQASP
jgi:diaminohydroxyphosphoribosylaminopyrimidine deaminase / 5-amino-6-(5-phosphoribosylamino)uracil reductase